MRLWDLPNTPPGITHDEAGHGQDALAIVDGARPIYQTIGYGREPLYDYLTAAFMALTGRMDYLALRWVSMIAGLGAVAGVYLWVRRAIGRWEAILSAGWLALSFWAVATSRQGLRSGLLPGLLIGAIYAWWRGTYDADRGAARWFWYVGSGLFTAATLWTYMAARVTWALLLAYPLYLLLVDRARLKERWPGMLLAVLVMGAVAAPMFVWLQRHPGVEQRFSQLGEPLQLLLSGDIGEVAANSVEALGMFTVRGDDLWVYTIPGRPWLGPLVGVLFYAGVVLALLRWRQPALAFSLMWLGAGLVPSLVTGVSASTTRAIAILPVLAIFPAIALTTLLRWLWHRWRWVRRLAAPLSLALLLLTGVRSVNDYFRVWAHHPEVRVAYHTILFEIAQVLDEWQVPEGTAVAISSIYPGPYHDPYAMDLLLSRRDLALRWFDGRASLVFPPQEARLVVPAIAPLAPVFEPTLTTHAELLAQLLLYPDDVNPGFSVYRWEGSAALSLADAQQGLVGWSDATTFPAQDPLAAYELLELPATLGDLVTLVGYTIPISTVKPGEQFAVVTYWQVLGQPDTEWETVLFTHLLNVGEAPSVVAQQDRLDVPGASWFVGDTFAQVHRIAIGPDVRPGRYPLEVGAYTRPIPTPLVPDPPTERLPLAVDGRLVDDRILLPPVEVVQP